MTKFQLTASAFFFGIALIGFQNCSKTSFGGEDASLASLLFNADGSVTQNFSAETMKQSGKVDLLFVVDESASMNVILNAVVSGFESIATLNYPPDSRMAVTNMAPAYYTDVSSGIFDPTRSWVANAAFAQQPGFIKLVSDASIASFLSVNPAQASHFPHSGCAEGWFAPNAMNSSNISCLKAHSQIALYGTGVEAGLTSLDQLVKATANSGQRLFRPDTLVNVIFVSDTHDPGATYYGRPGAAPNLPGYSDLVRSIHDKNPGLAGLKFNGIVPLPPAGDPALSGVITLGSLPADLEKSKISSEALWDFHYLPYIAQSGGIAMHPIGNDWKAVIEDLVKGLAVTRAPVVVLAKPAERIIRVIVNGETLTTDKYTLLGDARTIQFSPNPSWPNPVSISVDFLRQP